MIRFDNVMNTMYNHELRGVEVGSLCKGFYLL